MRLDVKHSSEAGKGPAWRRATWLGSSGHTRASSRLRPSGEKMSPVHSSSPRELAAERQILGALATWAGNCRGVGQSPSGRKACLRLPQSRTGLRSGAHAGLTAKNKSSPVSTPVGVPLGKTRQGEQPEARDWSTSSQPQCSPICSLRGPRKWALPRDGWASD